jgi:transposase, IS5 family
MLRDRYDPLHLFERIPPLGMQMDPVLTQIDTLLTDDTMFQRAKTDLRRRFPHIADHGRPSTPVEVILRLLVVKPLYGWSFPATTHFVADSLGRRQCCRISCEAVPDQSPLHRWAQLIQPAMLHRWLEHIPQVAYHLQVTPGRQLRLDGPVVAPTIHHPTDSTLRHDGVRGLSRALRKATTLRQDMAAIAPDASTDSAPQARDKMQRIMEVARQRGEAAAERLKTTYRARINLTTTVVARARHVQERLTAQATATTQRIAETLGQFIPLVEQGITQTPRRVLPGEQVPASEKIVSLFEPDTAIIRKGKPGKPTECGRGVWLDEVEDGLISRYAVLDGNPDEKAPLPPSLDHHLHQCGHPPDLLTGDRGLHSTANERYAPQCGGTEVVRPKPGKQSAKRLADERQEWFRAGRNWREGIAGRISGLKRRHQLDRCRYHGPAGMERWVGLGVIAHDLHVIAQHLTS